MLPYNTFTPGGQAFACEDYEAPLDSLGCIVAMDGYDKELQAALGMLDAYNESKPSRAKHHGLPLRMCLYFLCLCLIGSLSVISFFLQPI